MIGREGAGKATAVVLVLASLLLGIGAGLLLQRDPLSGNRTAVPEEDSGEPDIVVRGSALLAIENRVEAYKNGVLVHAKEGDPWTLNVARLIKLLFFTHDGTDFPDVQPTAVQQPNRLTTVTLTLTAVMYPRVRTAYAPVIGIGSGNATPSVNDVSLQSTIALYDVLDPSNVAFADAGPFYWLNITGSFTGLAVTVSEVGLFVRMNDVTTPDPRPPDQTPLVLLSRDVISPPISLVAEDVLVVKYAFRIYKNVLVRYGLCDLVQFVFGLGEYNLRGSFPCPRVISAATYPVPVFEVGAAAVCGSGYNRPCVRMALATQSIAYTDRFSFTGIPSGISTEVRSPATEIVNNGTHIVIRTTFKVGVASDVTIYGLVIHRERWDNEAPSTDSVVVTYTAFTTRVVTVGRNILAYAPSFVAGYPLMFVPFDPPVTVPAGSKVRIVLELALPIS